MSAKPDHSCTESSTPQGRELEGGEPQTCPHFRVVESHQLFGATREVRIHHFGQEYRLRITRQRKLILTK